MNIIYDVPKYRNLIAVSSFYEYIASGKCTSLAGKGEAYVIYDLESRLDRIITDLHNIHLKLDQIKDNQYMLYCSLCETNNTLARIENSNRNIMNSVGAIRENTELTAYNSNVAAINASAARDFLVLREFFR